MRQLVVAAMVLVACGCGSEQTEEPPRWSAAQVIGAPFTVDPFINLHSPGGQPFVDPRVAWTGGGTAVAVWSDLWHGLWAAELGPSGAWTGAAYVAHPDRVPVPNQVCSPFPCTPVQLLGQPPAVVAVTEGAAAFWQQTNATAGPGIWSVAFQSGGWSPPSRQQAIPVGAVRDPIARSAGSELVVAWLVVTNEGSSLWAQRSRGGAPLEEATRLQLADFLFQPVPAADIDRAGTAVVVWNRSEGVHARWSSAAGWGPDHVLPAAGTECPVVALDGAGGATVAWRQRTGAPDTPNDAWVSVARLRPDTGWGSRESFSDPSSRSGCPQITSGPSGDTVLLWANAGTNRGLWARPLRAGTPASPATRIDSLDAAHEIDSFRVAMDAAGEGYAAWVRARSDTASVSTGNVVSARGTVWASHFVNGGAGWEPPEILQPSASARADVAATVDVGVDANGDALAVWLEFSNGTFTPWASRARPR